MTGYYVATAMRHPADEKKPTPTTRYLASPKPRKRMCAWSVINRPGIGAGSGIGPRLRKTNSAMRTSGVDWNVSVATAGLLAMVKCHSLVKSLLTTQNSSLKPRLCCQQKAGFHNVPRNFDLIIFCTSDQRDIFQAPHIRI